MTNIYLTPDEMDSDGELKRSREIVKYLKNSRSQKNGHINVDKNSLK